MQPHSITPATGSDPDVRWLIGQHERDLEERDRAADRIVELEARCACAEARCARYAADQASLILQSHREDH